MTSPIGPGARVLSSAPPDPGYGAGRIAHAVIVSAGEFDPVSGYVLAPYVNAATGAPLIVDQNDGVAPSTEQVLAIIFPGTYPITANQYVIATWRSLSIGLPAPNSVSTVRVTDPAFSLAGNGPVNVPRPVFARDPRGVLIFRECIRFAPTPAVPTTDLYWHGFGMGSDPEWTNPDIGAGNNSFVGLCFDPGAAPGSAGRVRLAFSYFAPPTFVNLPSLAELSAGGWSYVDHRFYQPTVTRPARYELHVDGVLVFEREASDAVPSPVFPFPGTWEEDRACATVVHECRSFPPQDEGIVAVYSELIVGPPLESVERMP